MSSPVGEAVLALMDQRSDWSGTATELHRALASNAGEDIARRLPKSASHLSRELNRIAHSLRLVGVEIEIERFTRRRRIELRRKK